LALDPRDRDASLDDARAPLVRVSLAVSGLVVELMYPTGAEDLLMAEAQTDDLRLSLALAERLARAVDDSPIEWAELPVCDLQVLVLRVRQSLIGDRIVSEVTCKAAACGRRVDISFDVSAYVAHHAPASSLPKGRRWSVERAAEPGWFRLVQRTGETAQDSHVLFRIPVVADQLAALDSADAETEIAHRCIRPDAISVATRRRVEAAMEAMAPSLADEIAGVCSECGAKLPLFFDPQQFCLRELRERAAFVYQDVDLLARRYHWSEREILAMSYARRATYVELARQQGVS
jgi:hypothetical protein